MFLEEPEEMEEPGVKVVMVLRMELAAVAAVVQLAVVADQAVVAALGMY